MTKLTGRPPVAAKAIRIVSFPVSGTLWEKIREQAVAEGRPVKAVMRDAVALYLATTETSRGVAVVDPGP